jgi:hypothetical protein
MLNNNDFILIASAFNELHTSSSNFDKIRENIEAKKENDTFLPTQLIEIQQEYQKRKEELEKFSKEIEKLEFALSPGLFNDLKHALANQMASLDRMINDVGSYIDTRDSKYIESVVYGFSLEKEQNEILNKSVLLCESDLGMYIFSKALKEEIKISELTELINKFDPNSSLYKNIAEVIEAVKKKKEGEKLETKPDEVTKPVEATPVVEPTRVEIKPKEPTLEQKINRVQYKGDGNIHAEVQTLTAEERLKQVSAQIKAMESKNKLSMKETIRLHTLKSQELSLQGYMGKIGDNKLSLGDRGRDNNLSKTSDKINTATDNLKLSQENLKNYNSKTMRFFSMRYQEQLQANIVALQQKSGMLTHKQKMSSIAKFNKASKKINRKAKFAGLVNGIKDITTRKIEDLKRLKEEVMLEVSNVKQDVRRFYSQRESIPKLQEMTGIMPDNIISIEEYLQYKNQAMVA